MPLPVSLARRSIASLVVLASTACAGLRTPVSESTPPRPTQGSPTPGQSTMLPRVAPEVAARRLESLLKDNGGCRLPCFWSIAPGETAWREAYILLAPLSTWITPPIDGEFGNFGAGFAELPLGYQGLLEVSVYVEGGTVERIHASGLQTEGPLHLAQVMTEYGPPSEVWLYSWSQFFGSTTPLGVFLLYGDLGILAQYEQEAEYNDGTITACFDDTASLRLWDAATPMTFLDVKAMFNFTKDGIDLPSEDAISMEVEEFYTSFSGVDKPCISTPRCKWPRISGAPTEACP
jgi:hypothetical protein